MAFFVAGNIPIDSTQGAATDPSSAALLAELDSTNFGPGSTRRQDRLYAVSIYLGGSTAALWVVEQATSTALNSFTVQKRFRTASNQHSQFVAVFNLEGDDRIRVRHPSTVSGSFEAALQAQEIA